MIFEQLPDRKVEFLRTVQAADHNGIGDEQQAALRAELARSIGVPEPMISVDIVPTAFAVDVEVLPIPETRRHVPRLDEMETLVETLVSTIKRGQLNSMLEYFGPQFTILDAW